MRTLTPQKVVYPARDPALGGTQQLPFVKQCNCFLMAIHCDLTSNYVRLCVRPCMMLWAAFCISSSRFSRLCAAGESWLIDPETAKKS